MFLPFVRDFNMISYKPNLLQDKHIPHVLEDCKTEYIIPCCLPSNYPLAPPFPSFTGPWSPLTVHGLMKLQQWQLRTNSGPCRPSFQKVRSKTSAPQVIHYRIIRYPRIKWKIRKSRTLDKVCAWSQVERNQGPKVGGEGEAFFLWAYREIY